MEGTLNGKRGMFPDNFVKVQKQTKKVTYKVGCVLLMIFQSIPPPPPSIKPKKEVKIFVAAYTYDAANKDELSFKEGQKIEFIEDLEDGWATGKLLDNGIIGLYPTNFVEVCLAKIPRIQFFLQMIFEVLVCFRGFQLLRFQ